MVVNGKVTGREITKNRDGDNNVMMLQVEITDPDDIQTVQLFKQAGEDTNPPDDSKVVIVKIGDAWKIAIASDDNIEPSVDVGEKKLYSSDLGQIKASIHLKNGGGMDINADSDTNITVNGKTVIDNTGDIELLSDSNLILQGSTDFAVRFNALKIAFDTLKTAYNAHISTYNAHQHPETGGTTDAPTTTDSPTTADIDPSKIINIKVPGV